jgi:6-phosphogluconate dehydrogenase
MVHNGIEYGDMQLIAEAYALLKHIGGFSNNELHDIFTEWNEGELSSFLIEITAKVINFKDDQGTGQDLIDLILDQAGQKGTGKWTTQAALDLGVAIPTITAAVDARLLSGRKSERVAAEKAYGRPAITTAANKKAFANNVRAALYLSKICSYAQGMSLILESDSAFDYELNLPEIARIWKAGCIIRAQFLDKITEAFRAEPKLPNLLMAPGFQKEMAKRIGSLREVIQIAAKNGVASPAMSASLAYFDAYTTARGSANLIQAQRDFFGAHTYQRTDKEGTFHTEWNAKGA